MDWPFVGRSADVERLHTTLQRGQARGALLVGAPGTGKTRLARAVVEAADQTGRPTAWVAATGSTQPISFGAVSRLIEDAPPPTPTGEFLQALLGTVTDRIGAGQRLVLGVDDAHLLDDASAAVVHHLCVAGACFAVITAGDGEALPAAVDALWRDGSLERFEVRPLEPDDVDAVARAALDGTVDPFTLAELGRLSKGNPLLLRELVLGGLDSGALHLEDASWIHDEALAGSEGVARVIEARHEGLDEQELELLELLAVGEPLNLDLLASETARLEALERRGLVTLDDAVVRLAHPLHAEVLRARLHGLRARRLHARLAALFGADAAPEDLLRIADWQLASGDPPDTDTLVAAARQALAVLDLDLAERLASAAGDDPRALATLGQVHMAAGRWTHAQATLEGVGPAGAEAVALARGGRPLEGLAQLEATGTDGTLVRALVLLEAGEPRHAGALLDAAVPTGPEEQLDLHTAASLVEAWLGRPVTALRHVEAGLALAAGCRETRPLAEAGLEMHRVHALGLAGRIHEAEALARSAYDRSLLAGSDELAGAWGVWLGQTLLLRGHPDAAATALAEAGSRLARSDPFAMAPGCLALRALSAAMRGVVDEAQAHLEALDELTARRRHRFVAWSGRARAWVAAQQGDLATAVSHGLHAAAAEVADTPTAWGALALHDAVRLGQAAAPELHDALAGVEGDVLPLLADHARALEDGDGVALSVVSAAFEDLGADLLAAEAENQAAAAHRADGRKGQAHTSWSRARELAARCQGAATPAFGPPPAGLTARELEVATLAGQGLMDQDIASQLNLSVRTVENHLHRSYAKLGVTGRAELPAALA